MTQHREYGFSGAFSRSFTRQWIDKMAAAIPHP
jgi:hypothetical protein